eukprot:jgi/Ulvmu1/996/UM103_0024.1
MDQGRVLAGSNAYPIHSQYTEDAEGANRREFTSPVEGFEHKEGVEFNSLPKHGLVEHTAAHNHAVPLLHNAVELPRNAPSQECDHMAILDSAQSPTVAEQTTRGRRLASKNVFKVVQMFKSSSQNLDGDTASPRQANRAGEKRARSPACEATTPRSRLNPATPSAPSPPPAGGSGHTASTAVAADRLVGEEPISSTEITAGARGSDDQQPVRYPGYEGVNTIDPRYKVTEHFQGGVVEGKPSEGKPRLALLFDGPEHEYQDEYNWRKYGKKPIKGYVNPRFYWRCTFDGCGVQRHTQLLTTGETEVLYDGCHCHLPPPAKAARGRGRGRVVSEVPAAVGRALDAVQTRDSGGPTPRPSAAAASGGTEPPLTDAAAAAGAHSDPAHTHGEAAAKRKALFMRSARMKAPTAAAMMNSPAEDEDEEDAPPTKRVRVPVAAPAAAPDVFPQSVASPRAASGGSPPVAAGPSTRPSVRRSAGTRSPMRTPSAQNMAAEVRQSVPMDPHNLSRCPLYFLACVAAKEKFTSST